ncbi:hypothetical protein GJ686_09845 [Klebsiella variicola]|uniref:hypothetical protein n=1 Tax=Klebsiella variicola TaxID=244366 RepID=UPI0012DF1591|nr:hypothetical protein [Klebsiella variicola]MUM48631.1 hypothetical protein [Klebsiella variicola]MUM54884.1 hypothetical protein [Klebsiella variicola]
MADNSESFATIEQITSRPNFSSDLEITVKNFRSLVGRYHLSESVKCQVKTEHGNCGQKHQHGYLGVDDTGHEGLIGGICGDKYFGEHTQYIQERKRIDAELDRRESIEKLISYKDNFLSLSSTYANLLKEAQNIQNKINRLYKGFPDIVLTYIYQAQRTQNWDLYIDVLRHTRGEKGMTSNWYIEKLCTFPPLPSPQEISSLLGRIENLQTIFSEACSKNIEELATPKLKNYVKNIAEFSELESTFNKLFKNTEDFTHKNIVFNLYYACANAKDKFSTVKTIISLLKKSNPRDALIIKKCDEIEESTRKRFDNCEIRYNKKVMKFKKNSLG